MKPVLVRPFKNLDVWGYWVNAQWFALVVPYVVTPERLHGSRN